MTQVQAQRLAEHALHPGATLRYKGSGRGRAWGCFSSGELSMAIHERLQERLDHDGIDYQVIHHREDFQARVTADDTDTAPDAFAKTVVIRVDEGYALAVLPATHHLATDVLARSIGAREVRLASEPEMQEHLHGCEVGAEPPIGALYDLPTYASPLLARQEHITFNAGTHRDAVRLRWADYERLARPTVVPLSHHEERDG